MSKKWYKVKRPIDYVGHDPLRALKEVFSHGVDLDFMFDELPFWFYMALSTKPSVYDDDQERRNFVGFYFELTYLVEALYFLNRVENHIVQRPLEDVSPDLREWELSRNRCRNLSEEQAANPLPLIMALCKQHSLLYARIELGHFFEAVGNYKGRFTRYINGQSIFSYYLNLLCLVEVSYQLTKKPTYRNYKPQ